jgi:methylated-DNA-[protein]-cysteine S-methyltransferase|tara:strand:+ start:296 stop:634 length:339 start_codon:yes stop_codon:yes gene_type:complete
MQSNKKVTKFENKVYDLCKKVPKGKVTTYKTLANKLGTKAYRAVGQALRNNPYAPNVPCHRVISSSGKIGGFMGKNNVNSKDVKRKIALLKKEKIVIKNNKIEKKYNYKFKK